MQTELRITAEPLNESELAGSRKKDPTLGAAITFLGVVRDSEDGKKILAIEYEAFEAMARHQFERIFAEAAEKWPAVQSVRLHHRIGRVDAGEASLWIEVASPHRRDAFESCLWIIEEMKRLVPIWKRPVFESIHTTGTSE